VPGGAAVHWVHREARPAGQPLVEAVRTATFPAGRGQAWLAGESAAVKELRGHLLTEVPSPPPTPRPARPARAR